MRVMVLVSCQRAEGVGQKLMVNISLPCFYLCQFDNELHSAGSCNMTSLGMVLKQYGKAQNVPGSYARVSDRLLQYCDANGFDRHSLGVIRNLAVKFGLKDDASYAHTFDEIKAHLGKGELVIIQGNFTPSGHVIVFCGFNSETGTWVCNDPAGDHTAPNGYHEPGWGSGDHVRYPSEWVHTCAAPDGDGKVWAHLLEVA